MVFREHAGPYWRVGPVLAETHAYMVEQGRHGPTFMRFAEHPLVDTRTSMRSDVGFFTERELTPRYPFRLERRPSALVAFMVVEGRTSSARRDFNRLDRWVEAHGYDPGGAIYEIYTEVPGGLGGAAQRTEIQFTLRVASEPGKDLSGRLTTEATTSAVASAKAVPTKRAYPARARSKPLGVRSTQKTLESPRGAGTIRKLYDARRFDSLALHLMPEDAAMSPPTQLWFGQVMFRIRALGRGLQRLDPGEADPTLATVAALGDRYTIFSREFKVDPLAQAVVRVESNSDETADLKRSIMRNLDRLLGRVALGTVSLETSAGELVDVLEQLEKLVEQSNSEAHNAGVGNP